MTECRSKQEVGSENRNPAVIVWALALAAVGVALTAGILAATVPVSSRYEVSDILARMSDYLQFHLWSEPIEIPEAEKLNGLAELIVQCCGGDDGGLMVLPEGKAFVVTGTLLQHWHVRQILGKLRAPTEREGTP